MHNKPQVHILYPENVVWLIPHAVLLSCHWQGNNYRVSIVLYSGNIFDAVNTTHGILLISCIFIEVFQHLIA